MQTLGQIKNNPLEVPLDERPVPLDQMFEQETTVVTDQVTGKPARYQRSIRNGVPQWSAVDIPDDPTQDIEIKQRQLQQQLKHNEQSQELAAKTQQENMMYKRHESEVRVTSARHEAEMRSLENRIPDKKNFTSKDANKLDVLDQAGFDAALKTYQQEVRDLTDRQLAEIRSLSRWHGKEASGSTSNGAPAAIESGQIPYQTDENGTDRVVVASDEDAIRYGLPDGTPIIDPNGRTGIWTNQ
jgi:hypothetical protein